MKKVTVTKDGTAGWFVVATPAHIGIEVGPGTEHEMWVAGGDQCWHMQKENDNDTNYRMYFVTRQHAREWAKLVNNIKHEEQA